jgi:hypothetical protein
MNSLANNQPDLLCPLGNLNQPLRGPSPGDQFTENTENISDLVKSAIAQINLAHLLTKNRSTIHFRYGSCSVYQAVKANKLNFLKKTERKTSAYRNLSVLFY